MIKIPSLNDRFNLLLGDVTFVLKPMTYSEKMEIETEFEMESGKIVPRLTKQIFLLLKYMIDDVKGLKNFDESDYVVEKDKSGNLSEDTISELLNLGNENVLLNSIYSCRVKMPPDSLIDISTTDVLKGARIEYAGKKVEVVEGKK